MSKPNQTRRWKLAIAAIAALGMFGTLSLVGVSQTSAAPACSSASADSDGDGWGWENNQSCRVVQVSQSTLQAPRISHVSNTFTNKQTFTMWVSSAQVNGHLVYVNGKYTMWMDDQNTYPCKSISAAGKITLVAVAADGTKSKQSSPTFMPISREQNKICFRQG